MENVIINNAQYKLNSLYRLKGQNPSDDTHI